MPLERRLVTDRLHLATWYNRRDRGLAPTITSDDLDLYFCDIDIHLKENFRNQYLGTFLYGDTPSLRAPAV